MAAIEVRGIQKNVSGKWGIAMKILNFGSLNIDYVYKVDHIVQRGETQHSISRSVFSGGKGLNQSVALVKAGLPVYHAAASEPEGNFFWMCCMRAVWTPRLSRFCRILLPDIR